MTTHRMRNTKLYSLWADMKRRCHKTYKRHKDYADRGITICDEWKNDFMNFYEWSMKNGYQEGLSIDRRDNDGNYEPNNCRWITMEEQARNKRSNHLITIDGETKLLVDWAKESGVSSGLIIHRLKQDIVGKDLLAPPKEQKKIIINYNNKEYNPHSFCKEFDIPKTSFYRMYLEECKTIEEILKKYNK